jgi:hypothetical protein
MRRDVKVPANDTGFAPAGTAMEQTKETAQENGRSSHH